MIHRFPSTKTTLVRGLVERNPEAARQFFEKYRAPLLAYAKGDHRLTYEDAEECVNNLFAGISSGDILFSYNPGLGRFCSFLVGALKHRISTFVRDANTKKRGGGIEHIPLDESPDMPDTAASTHAFDREWAVQITILAMARLEAEYTTDAQKHRFARLKGSLTANPNPSELATLASAFGVDPDSVSRDIRTIRAAFRRCLRAEVRETLHNPTEAEVDTEFAYLRDIVCS